MGEGTDRPMGERRRRREAERAAARAAADAGTTRPLTRRELRWQQAEEAARLEAIATGELPLGQAQAAVPPPVGGTTDESAPSAPSVGSATTAESAPSAGSAPSADAAPSQVPSRRSLRDRVEDAAAAPPERPQERTATGRRPVVRTPSTAQGVRSLDATGRLTGIQPVVRPDPPDRPAAPRPDDETAPDTWSERATFSVDLDGPAQAARAALPPDPAAPHEREVDEPDEDGDFSMRPQWVAISGVSGATPDDAAAAPPSRRSVRPQVGESAPGPDPASPPERPNPAVTAIKVAVLVVVAAVIGALIWLLASEAFDDEPAGAAPAPVHTTAPDPEETSAR